MGPVERGADPPSRPGEPRRGASSTGRKAARAVETSLRHGGAKEALTAVALLCQIFMTDTKEVKKWSDHENYEMMKKAADLIISKPPKWDENDGSIDMYYWYYCTFAMNQWGGKHWTNWKKAIEKALLPNQRKDTPDKKDNFYGSWDPAGPWGEEGGRVYSTAICALMLEVYYRYAQVLGAR